jgi:putative tryptophan/tyrosine transport system substrate-binding protein
MTRAPSPLATILARHTKRREFLLLLGGMMTAARSLGAQQKAMPVVGLLTSITPNELLLAAFHQGLSENGYAEGKNLAIEYRSAGGEYNRLPALAADLVGRKVDVIVTLGGASSALPAKDATSTIPITFSVGDAVERGLVASLARPGGNLTGVSQMSTELPPKRLELLSDLVPDAGVIALLVNPDNPGTEPMIRGVQEAARSKGLQLRPKGQRRGRDRRRFRLPRPSASRRAVGRRRSILRQPPRKVGGAGGAACRSGDL